MNDIALKNLNSQKKIIENYYEELRETKELVSETRTADTERKLADKKLIKTVREKINHEVTIYIFLLKKVSQQVETKQLKIEAQESEAKQLVATLLNEIKAMGQANTQVLLNALEDQSKTAALRLEGAIPLIPGFLTLKGDVTQTETWVGIANKLNSFLGENENPQQPRQEPTLD